MDAGKKITCYSYDSSREYPNNVKCPGSDSCCETLEQCRPDRLCTSKDDPKTLIRAPCAHKPWTNSCAQVCLYDNRESLILPRAVICEVPGSANGSYCCDDNRTCCIDKAGFFLDSNGVLVGRANDTNPSSTRSMSGAGSTATSTPAPKPKDRTGLSVGAKIGIGVGVGAGVLIVIALATLLYLHRQRQKRRRARSALRAAESQEDKNSGPLLGQEPEKDRETHELAGQAWKPELELEGEGQLRSELPVPGQTEQHASKPAELPGGKPAGST